MKLDLDKISSSRKLILTTVGVLYALSMLGNALYKDPYMIVGVTLAFLAVLFVLFLWVK